MTPPVNRKASAAATPAERELLARLGLKETAADDDVETAHADLVKFLAGAPAGLKQWAERETAAADEAYALLSDPNADLGAVAGTSEPPAAPARKGGGLLSNRVLIGVVAVAAAAVLGIVVYQSGDSSSTAADQTATATDTTTTGAPQVDQAKVAALMTKISANPKDVASLTALGDVFFQAGDYNTAGGWMTKVVVLEPKNVKARLALGAAQFNLGNVAAAEKEWKQVIVLAPRNVEAYYDLGFLYLSKKPSDTARAKAAWSKVIEIAPKSAVAKTIATHLKGLDGSATTTPTTTTGK
jgi:cytochrome c-type biogenesis protein CcmH/NrfG